MGYDVVFIYMNVISNGMISAEYQLESAYARSYLKKHNISSAQYINKNPGTILSIVDGLERFEGKNYVFFINEYNYYISRQIINELKLKNYKTRICSFGPVIDFISKNLLNEIFIDICIKDKFAYQLKDIISTPKISNINGITYRNGSEFIDTDDFELDYSLDQLGLVYSEGLIPPEEVQNVGLLTSVGCYATCSFCSYCTRNDAFIVHEIENVITELKFLNEYYRDSIKVNFFDDCFSRNNKRTLKLCERIIEENFNFIFSCCTRADLLSEDLIKAFSDANFTSIVIGLETASVEVMDKLGKVKENYKPAEYIEYLRLMYIHAKKYGISPIVTINLGLPYEEFADVLKTISFIRNNNMMNNTSVCFMTSFPKSKVFENSEYYGVKKEASPTGLPYRTYYTKYNMRTIYNNLYSEGFYFIQKAFNELLVLELLGFLTGIMNFKNNFNSNGIYFIKVEDYNESNIHFIDKNVNINGKVIFIRDKIEYESSNVFCDDRKNLKLKLKEYDKNLSLSVKNNKYLPRQMFIEKDRIIIDNIYNPEILKLNINKINSLEDMNVLKEKSLKVLSNSYITLEEVKNGISENMCSFSGICSLRNLCRVSIKNESVYGCLNKGEIGVVSSDSLEIFNNVKILLSNKEEQCMKCEARKWCSQCLWPPSFLKNEFCEFVKSNPFLSKYMRIIYFLNIHIRGIERIKSDVFYLFESKIGSEKGFKEGVFLITCEDFNLLIDYENNNALSCSDWEANVALMILGKQSKIKNSDYYRIFYKFESLKLIYAN